MTENKQQRPILIASFSAVSEPAPHLTHHSSLITHHCLSSFLFNTNKPHRIIIPMTALLKTKEKQFSIRYKFALRSVSAPATAGRPIEERSFAALRMAARGNRRGDSPAILRNVRTHMKSGEKPLSAAEAVPRMPSAITRRSAAMSKGITNRQAHQLCGQPGKSRTGAP